jgi:hypothetical protein
MNTAAFSGSKVTANPPITGIATARFAGCRNPVIGNYKGLPACQAEPIQN